MNDQAPRSCPLAVAVLGALLLILAAGCGTSDPGGDPAGTGAATVDDEPRVADARFDGTFEVVELTFEGSAIALAGRPTMEIDATFGGLTVVAGCNEWLGSFTLAEDGTASFTLTGGTDLDCGDLAAQEDAVLAALGLVEAWAAVDGGFRFDGPATALVVMGPNRP